ncbi:unnamed protein product [Rotaria sp. Silwood2]|nr:unnamed protein product [Rotaria sp. Silwood2]
MNADNVESYLRDNYDRRILLTYRTVKKFYLRTELVRLDIRFLKSCRAKDIIPKFLWFKTANRNLASSSAYKDSQRRLLNVEINYKYQHLNRLKKMYRYSASLLQQYCFGDLFERIQQIITTICCPIIKEKEETVERKLFGHSLCTQQRYYVDRKVVKNLSARILLDDEIDCLANGLDYGLVSRRFDEMGAVGNIEQFSHHVPDIFQHHEKLMADLKDKDKVILNDIRVLNTMQMTLTSNLRSLTDTFQHQANRYRKQHYMVRGEQQQYYQLLKSLKQDKSIIVTRPDKGRGIVLVNKSDYLSKMNAILDDSTKFRCLFGDPTIQRERSLSNLLYRLKKNGHISQEFYNMTRPTGSNPERLYGLPKIHKENMPLRPVRSSIGTYNYGLAKVLKQMLSSIIQNEVIVKDTFAFVNELRSLPKSASKYKMVSFDITSLYTNIPVNETIDIILKHLYNDERPPPTIKKNDMKKLLEFVTEKSHFIFNGKIYDQVDGVSMGSPLAPLLAEIFLQEFEKKHLPLFDLMGIGYWKRYVDDNFVLLHPRVCPDYVCDQLSKCHASIKFTVAKEDVEANSITFLDALAQRQTGVGFKTKVYRKDTFPVHRAIKIYSTYLALHDEFDFIRELALKNGYPNVFVESVIQRKLNSIYAPRPTTPPTPDTDIIVLRIQYYGKPSQIYGKRVMAAVAKQYPLKKVQVVYDVKARIGQHFTTEDKIQTELKSSVVYEATCPLCNEKYVGKTCCHFQTRINEHLSDQKKAMSPTTNPSTTISNQHQSSNITIASKNSKATAQSSNQRTSLHKPSNLKSNIKKTNQLIKCKQSSKEGSYDKVTNK